jgi:CTP:molybdopterin cytidylyltransferase MocA
LVAACGYADAVQRADRHADRADYGDHQGTPLLLDRSVWPLAQQIRGDQDARALLRVHPDTVITVPVALATAADVDTWNDYERLPDA